ncbi:MAG: hypothetical protein IJO27_00100 [Bacilli bacterium]|nr:hypothetical protein [Bacilli bacterium]MBQ6816812.1 hypothetical protein [Bacilli bacterium]
MNDIQCLFNEMKMLREENRRYYEQMIGMQNQMMQMFQTIQQLMSQANLNPNVQNNTSAQHEFKTSALMEETRAQSMNNQTRAPMDFALAELIDAENYEDQKSEISKMFK